MTGRHRTAAVAATLTVVAGAGAAYWSLFSSYSQLLGPFPHRGRTEEKVVALTFDDGPNEPYTSQIADILLAASAPATFFQVGQCARRHPEVTARLLREGHVIGNHSLTHTMRRCLRHGEQRQETVATQAILTGISGRRPALYRPPWLLRTPSLFRVLAEQGLHPVAGVFCHAFEVFQPDPARIARRALAKVRPGTILIFHDGFDARGGNRAHTVAAVATVVNTLSDLGYRFVTLDELLGVPAYQDDPDDLHRSVGDDGPDRRSPVGDSARKEPL